MIRKARQWLRHLLNPNEKEQHVSEGSERGGYPPVIISPALALRTQQLLRSFNGRHGREGLVYWAGLASGRGGVVTTLVVPDADSDYGRVDTSPEENARIISWLAEQDLVFLGQAHSHPPGAGTRHSTGDDLKTFSPFEGQVSVVVADHATAEWDVLNHWGVHRFIGGKFCRIDRSHWERHLRVVPGEIDCRLHSQASGPDA